MIEILGKQIPNQLNELTIQQFEDITEIHNDSSLDIIEKHIKVFELLGVSEDEMVEADVDFETFKKYVQEFNQKTDASIIKEVEIDGYTYKAYEEEFKLSVKDMKVIRGLVVDDNGKPLPNVPKLTKQDVKEMANYAASGASMAIPPIGIPLGIYEAYQGYNNQDPIQGLLGGLGTHSTTPVLNYT